MIDRYQLVKKIVSAKDIILEWIGLFLIASLWTLPFGLVALMINALILERSIQLNLLSLIIAWLLAFAIRVIIAEVIDRYEIKWLSDPNEAQALCFAVTIIVAMACGFLL